MGISSRSLGVDTNQSLHFAQKIEVVFIQLYENGDRSGITEILTFHSNMECAKFIDNTLAFPHAVNNKVKEVWL